MHPSDRSPFNPKYREQIIWEAQQASENFPEDIPRFLDRAETLNLLDLETGVVSLCPQIPPGSMIRWPLSPDNLRKPWIREIGFLTVPEDQFGAQISAFFAKWPLWPISEGISYFNLHMKYLCQYSEDVDCSSEPLLVTRSLIMPEDDHGIEIQVMRNGSLGWIWADDTDMPEIVTLGDPNFNPYR